MQSVRNTHLRPRAPGHELCAMQHSRCSRTPAHRALARLTPSAAGSRRLPFLANAVAAATTASTAAAVGNLAATHRFLRRHPALPTLRAHVTAAATSSPGASNGSSISSKSSVKSLPVSELASRLGPEDAVVLWFRNDLRVDDHPGLTAAAAAATRSSSSNDGSGSSSTARSQSSSSASARPLVPVYVLDPDRLSYLAFTPGG
ncbi:hypothetical protein Agub_g11215, partial [Astrephomene gubernaculifera]